MHRSIPFAILLALSHIGHVRAFQAPTVRPTPTVLHQSNTRSRNQRNIHFQSAASIESNDEPKLNPSWREIFELPIDVPTKDQFDSIPLAKMIAIVSRVSVTHLTILSCLGPLILRGAVRSSLPPAAQAGIKLSPFLAFLFTIDGMSFHIAHNLLNDWQDLDDDDKSEDSFRLSYGCHALKQGFISKSSFLRLMGLVSLPGAILTFAFRNTVLAPAAFYGFLALFFYTILFKPIALGEVLIWAVWGPLMAGFGTVAAGAPWVGVSQLFTDPSVGLFGLFALAVIMGKHTDKITRSNKRTLPKLLGLPKAIAACGAVAVAPHVLLLITLVRQHLLKTVDIPSLPLGSALAFLTLFRELPGTLNIFGLGPLKKDPTRAPTAPGTIMKGNLFHYDVDKAWPLWFVAFSGWHAVSFGYLMLIGSGLEWAVRAMLKFFLL